MQQLTDKNLLIERPFRSGTQRLYRFANNHGLSVVQHEFSYGAACEIAVITFDGDDIDDYNLDYSTELTSDVEGFDTFDDANAFITRAAELFGSLNPETIQ